MGIIDDDDIRFSSEGFFNIILPPMVFQAGYNIRGHRILQNILFIFLYGIVGTLLSMLVFVFGLSYLNQVLIPDIIDVELSNHHILYLATLLSNWETHTCILILEEHKFPTLTSLMFGETMINDAVIIALFNSIHRMESTFNEQGGLAMDYISAIQELLIVGSASVAVGILFGLIISLILRLVKQLIADNPYLQMSFILVGGYLAFMVSEKLKWAGVLSIFCAGFTMAHYGSYSLSERGQVLTKVTLHFLGFVPESFVYAYLGLVAPSSLTGDSSMLLCVLCVIVGSLCIRAATVLLLFFIGSGLRCHIGLNEVKSTCILILAGIIKGSIPFALSLTIKPGEDGEKQVKFMQQLLLIFIFLTTPTLGSMVSFWISCIGVKTETGFEYIKVCYIK